MNTVRVSTSALLEKLKENRATHRTLFLEAQEGYRKMAIEELDKMLQNARDGKRFNSSLSLMAPQDMTREYDNAIEMLEMSVDAEQTITSTEFKCYVKDEWGWKNNFLASNAIYSGHIRAEALLSGC